MLLFSFGPARHSMPRIASLSIREWQLQNLFKDGNLFTNI